jgi:hypothetical protein
MSACTRDLASCLAPPGSSSMRHLCFTDNSVCPSKARAIKGSFQSHCCINVNKRGSPVVVSEVKCHVWAALKAAGKIFWVQGPGILICFYYKHAVLPWTGFLLSLDLFYLISMQGGLDLEILKDPSTSKICSVLCLDVQHPMLQLITIALCSSFQDKTTSKHLQSSNHLQTWNCFIPPWDIQQCHPWSSRGAH